MPPLEISIHSSKPDGNMPPYILGRRGFYTVADLSPTGAITLYKARRGERESFVISKKDLPHSATIKEDIKDRSGWKREITLAPGESHTIWLDTNTHFGKQEVVFKNIKKSRVLTHE